MSRLVPVCSIILLVSLFEVASVSAQTRELTSDDRLALLYAPQLNFTRRGDPIIRLGIVEGRSSITFEPSEPIRVLPQGEGGPEIFLPGDREYRVTISEPEAGAYKHRVVVNRLPIDQRKRLGRVKKAWMKRGFVPETIEVGGLFAVHGKVFDSRTILVGVAGTTNLRKARKIKRKLETKYGIQGSIHSEITRHPGGTLKLTGRGVDAEIVNRDVLTITGKKGLQSDIVFTVPKIPKSYGGGTETRRYTGMLTFAPDRKGKLVMMMSHGAEKILKGTVPAETYASAPKDALRAQAIAARNNMFSAIGVRNLADPYMLRADVMDQVYGGVGIEKSRTSKAVDATRGKVMFHGKKIIEAVYSSNAGGFTESNENVWDMEPRPWLRGHPDAPKQKVPTAFRDGISPKELDDFLDSDFPAFSKEAPVSSSRLYRWEKKVNVSSPRKWLKEHGRDVGRLTSAKVVKRGVSGRVVRLKLTGEKGSVTVERELNVRRLFGGLRSGLFTMKYRTNDGYITSFSFRGGGFGHGVGMCQTGAVGMASKGIGYEKILEHYYRGVSVETLY